MRLKRKVGDKGQVVIPKEIRKKKNIHPNTNVYFSIEGDKVVIQRENDKLSEVLSRISKKSEGTTETSDEYHSEEIEKRLKKSDMET